MIRGTGGGADQYYNGDAGWLVARRQRWGGGSGAAGVGATAAEQN